MEERRPLTCDAIFPLVRVVPRLFPVIHKLILFDMQPMPISVLIHDCLWLVVVGETQYASPSDSCKLFHCSKTRETVIPSSPWTPTEALSQAQAADDVPFIAGPETSIPDRKGATRRKRWVQMGKKGEKQKTAKKHNYIIQFAR